jgi:hypothetical protein
MKPSQFTGKSNIPVTNGSHNTQTIKNKPIQEEVKKNIPSKRQVTIVGFANL